MGIYLTDLADILRAAGLQVVEVSGWQRRGYRMSSTPDGGLLDVRGGLVHHTATAATYAPGEDYPTMRVILGGNGRTPGPLSQLGLGRAGTWYVIAAGRCNHSGAVDQVSYSNPYAIGVEAEHPGGSLPWPAVQYQAYVRGCAALGAAYKIKWRGHKEAAVPYGRKVDPTFDMDEFRRDVAAVDLTPGGIGGGMSGVRVPTPPKGAAWPDIALVEDGVRGPVTVTAWQTLLAAVDYYQGRVDGLWGPVSVRAEQEWLHGLGYYHGRIDGDEGPLTLTALQRFLDRKSLYHGFIDGARGPLTIRAEQAYLNQQRKYL